MRVLLRSASSPGVAGRLAGPTPDEAFADAVVRETLRLHPPAVAVLRRLTAPAQIGGWPLPAGTVAMVPIPLVQRDGRHHREPDRFRPERQLEPGAAPERAMLPFGGGARSCLGESLAWAQLRAVVPVVLAMTSLRPLGPQPEKMVLRATILVPRRSGLVLARPRPV